MAEHSCHCGFGEEYFTLEGGRSICTVCGGEVGGLGGPMFEITETSRKKKILLVDDQPFFRQRIRNILEVGGFTLIEASEGIEAVRLFMGIFRETYNRPGEGVELAILDLNMPGLIDGFQTLGVLKAIDENLPVLILTSSPPTQQLLQKLAQLRAKKYLNKGAKNLDELLLKNITLLS
jgi:CheY-like chemotaxis protein